MEIKYFIPFHSMIFYVVKIVTWSVLIGKKMLNILYIRFMYVETILKATKKKSYLKKVQDRKKKIIDSIEIKNLHNIFFSATLVKLVER